MRPHLTRPIVVATSNPLEHLGIAAVLKIAFHYERIEFASEHSELIELLESGPDLAIIDSELAGLSASEFRQIRAQFSSTALVVLMSDCSPQNVLNILGCGVHGIVSKSLTQAEMVVALRQVAAGNVYVPHLDCNSEFAGVTGVQVVPGLAVRDLTDRQQEVLELVSTGKSNKEVARQLLISEATVKVHLSAAFRSMGVHNRLSAVAHFRGSNH